MNQKTDRTAENIKLHLQLLEIKEQLRIILLTFDQQFDPNATLTWKLKYIATNAHFQTSYIINESAYLIALERITKK